jgi:prepilin-type N-terminal cleavage/methylation domain-containing protein
MLMIKLSACDCRSHPPGVTLIELMCTLTVLLSIALAGTSMLGKVTGIGLECKKADQARTDIARLSAKLRVDVHQSEQAVLGDAGRSIELTVADQITRYQFHPDTRTIIRRTSKSGESKSIESYSLTPRCRPQFDVQDRQVVLRLTAPEDRTPWIIEAVRP